MFVGFRCLLSILPSCLLGYLVVATTEIDDASGGALNLVSNFAAILILSQLDDILFSMLKA